MRVAKFLQSEVQDGGILAVAEERAEFSLRGRGNDKFAYSRRHLYGTIELDGTSVDGYVAEEEDAAKTTAGLGF